MAACFYAKFAVVTLIFVALIVGGYFVHTEIPRYVKKRVKEAFVIDTVEAQSFTQFVSPTKNTNIYNSYYLYNITNKEGMLERGEQPIVSQMGPYTYLKYSYKELDTLSWSANGTINFKYHDWYEFQPHMSSGTENDTLMTLDLGYIGLLTKVNSTTLGPLLIDALSKANHTPIVNLTVYQILWGYTNPVLKYLDEILKILNIQIPDVVSVQQQNDPTTWLNFSSAYTGGAAADGLPSPPSDSLLVLTRWAGYDVLPYWGSKFANMINGTDGTSFQPGGLTVNGPLVPVFVDSIYRSVHLSSASSRTYEGVELVSLELPPYILLDMNHNPENAPFGMRTTGFIPYPPSLGEPIYISLPHFLYANLSAPDVNVTYLEDAGAANYDIRLDVEPITGQLFVAHKRLQVNTYLLPNVNFPNNTVNTYAPVLYVDQNFVISDKLLKQYKDEVQLPIDLGLYGGIALIVVGSVGTVGSLIWAILSIRKKSRNADSELYDPMN